MVVQMVAYVFFTVYLVVLAYLVGRTMMWYDMVGDTDRGPFIVFWIFWPFAWLFVLLTPLCLWVREKVRQPTLGDP